MSCGPGRFNFKHPNPDFTKACDLHDIEYEGGVPRIEADINFLKNMLKVSRGLFDFFTAFVMFIWVLVAGFFFYGKKLK